MKKNKYDIHKAAGIIIVERKLLVTREKNMDFFISPGGKVGKGESPQDALIRELYEEVNIVVKRDNLREFGTYYAEAVGDFTKRLRLDAFVVLAWQGDPSPNDIDECIEEILWLSSHMLSEIKVGSIFEHEVIPRLKKLDLID